MDNPQLRSYTYISCDCEKLYIGFHTGFLDDNYLGSYHNVNFKPKHKFILSYHDTPEIASLLEWGFQNSWQVNINPRFVNQRIHSFGNMYHSKQTKEKMSKPKKDTSKMGRHERTAKVRKNMSDAQKGKIPWNKGKKLTDKQKEKMFGRNRPDLSLRNKQLNPREKQKRTIKGKITQLEKLIKLGITDWKYRKPLNMEKLRIYKDKVQRLKEELNRVLKTE